MTPVLVDPERANLLAILLHRLASRSGRPVPERTYRVEAGGMTARLVGGPEPRVESGGGPADCAVRGSLDGLLKVALGEGAVGAWIRGRVSFRGNPFGALALLRLCRS